MSKTVAVSAGLFVGLATVTGAAHPQQEAKAHDRATEDVVTTLLYPELEAYVAARVAEFEQISPERRAELEALAAYVREAGASSRAASLVFVCTHNSRRSQMAQAWALTAARMYEVAVHSYSGGTDVTAFNPRAVAALERAGFRVEKTTEDANPVYHVRRSDTGQVLTCFSKKYDNAPNPAERFAAVMVCGDADEACPIVAGADARLAIRYVDPKAADGTAAEAAAYDERCAQIAREMLYAMSRVRG